MSRWFNAKNLLTVGLAFTGGVIAFFGGKKIYSKKKEQKLLESK